MVTTNTMRSIYKYFLSLAALAGSPTREDTKTYSNNADTRSECANRKTFRWALPGETSRTRSASSCGTGRSTPAESLPEFLPRRRCNFLSSCHRGRWPESRPRCSAPPLCPRARTCLSQWSSRSRSLNFDDKVVIWNFEHNFSRTVLNVFERLSGKKLSIIGTFDGRNGKLYSDRLGWKLKKYLLYIFL